MSVRKIGWLVFSCLVVAGMALSSCGPAEEEEVDKVDEADERSDEPQYGGSLTQIVTQDTRNFDDVNPWE